MIHPDEAFRLLAEAVTPLPPVRRPLAAAAGTVLAEDVTATLDFPSAPVAAMDGYAVRAEEASGTALPVAFTVAAGDVPPPLPAGCCARIFTGAVVPTGANAVVAQEEVTLQGNLVRFPQAIPLRDNIRERGEVFARGETLARAGEVLHPALVGLLAAAGVGRVAVTPKPRVAVVATGSELAASRPRRGHIRDSNTPMLSSFLLREGFPLVGRGRVPDQLEDLLSSLGELLPKANVVITTGGVSEGDLDLLPEAVARLGGETLFHKVAMQPGKPVLVARIEERWFVGLPGNPVSALVGFRLLALPLLRALAGTPHAFAEPWTPLPLLAPVTNGGGRVQFRPAREFRSQGQTVVEVLPWKGSHDLKAAAAASCLARLEPRTRSNAGDAVPVLKLF
ncbi:MAG: gephyrin-like molybdotransferase Glp [Thermoanaerobaculum sp.]